jgi:hypothetical protein
MRKMETPTQPSAIYAAPPAKKPKTVHVKLLVAALAFVFCIATLSAVANILLYEKSKSLATNITLLQTEFSNLNTDVSTQKSSLESLKSADIAAIKTDISQLKDTTQIPDAKFTISTLKQSFYDGYPDEDDYYGKATVTCSDASSNYEVLIKETLNSGGTQNVSSVHYYLIDVVNGSGPYYTHDWGDKGKLAMPDYTLEPLGFIKLVKGTN